MDSLLSTKDLLKVFHLLFLIKVGQLVVGLVITLKIVVGMVMESLTANSSGKVHIFLENGHSIGMDGTQVGIFKDIDAVHLSSLLDC